MTALAGVAVAGLLLQVTLWLVQLRTRNAASIDLGWAVLVGAGSLVAAATGSGAPARRLVVAILAGLWALRLAGYLLRDRVLTGLEDGRYRALREHWGDAAPRNLLAVYLAQLPVAAIFLVPIVTAMHGGALDAWAVLGVLVWLGAAAGEAIADRQLARFRADPRHRGEVCRAGLWRYSRHPNYFFEWLHWWGYVLIGHAAPLTFVGPAAMLLFLFRITGIPYTEQQALRSRGDAYRDYQRTTSVFFPWPPTREAR